MIYTVIRYVAGLFTNRFRKNGYTGVHDDPQDYRDITLASFVPRQDDIPKYSDGLEEILQKLPILYQGYQPACVPHTLSILLMAYIYKATGKIVQVSPRIGYKICKILDGFDGPGTYPRAGAMSITKFGYCLEELCKNDTDLTYEEYLSVELTRDIVNSCQDNKLPGFAYVNPDIAAIKQAIHLYGAVAATTNIGIWNTLPLQPGNSGKHYTLWYKYKDTLNGDTMIFVRNSWGPKWLSWIRTWLSPGSGYFYWSDYLNNVSNIIAFTDIPKEFLNKVKNMAYRFTQQLGFGQDHPQVKELQKLLNKDPETVISLDGVGSLGNETSYFGPATKKALIKWQIKNGISPATGYFGPKSIAKANEGVGNINKITDWANAIKKHEGYFPGSRSYKNNNPGNIRYSGIYTSMAIGQDDKNFCIFKSYDDGFEALRTLLIRAATGLSSVYKPNMTLLEFYGKYAPKSDNNDPDGYARAVARDIGVPPSTMIKDLI